ncbi:Predicted membrane metal-binding protein [Pseudomonas syringae pv. actinidiae]|uniref:Predicted membrane metal-binding protein n=1 Tax=Pseudomonas syringae pv. actinidiae TaxID=103796 RepID=A0AAN4TQI3_PSESF|nr:Predicted membrane metal-binding protein [Pseudomonas syringae pv. actinidiae]
MLCREILAFVHDDQRKPARDPRKIGVEFPILECLQGKHVDVTKGGKTSSPQPLLSGNEIFEGILIKGFGVQLLIEAAFASGKYELGRSKVVVVFARRDPTIANAISRAIDVRCFVQNPNAKVTFPAGISRHLTGNARHQPVQHKAVERSD